MHLKVAVRRFRWGVRPLALDAGVGEEWGARKDIILTARRKVVGRWSCPIYTLAIHLVVLMTMA